MTSLIPKTTTTNQPVSIFNEGENMKLMITLTALLVASTSMAIDGDYLDAQWDRELEPKSQSSISKKANDFVEDNMQKPVLNVFTTVAGDAIQFVGDEAEVIKEAVGGSVSSAQAFQGCIEAAQQHIATPLYCGLMLGGDLVKISIEFVGGTNKLLVESAGNLGGDLADAFAVPFNQCHELAKQAGQPLHLFVGDSCKLIAIVFTATGQVIRFVGNVGGYIFYISTKAAVGAVDLTVDSIVNGGVQFVGMTVGTVKGVDGSLKDGNLPKAATHATVGFVIKAMCFLATPWYTPWYKWAGDEYDCTDRVDSDIEDMYSSEN